MKKSGKCPKCDSYEIYTNDETTRYSERSIIHLSGFRRLFVSNFVCLNCGFIEEHLDDKSLKDQKKMDQVKEKWTKVIK